MTFPIYGKVKNIKKMFSKPPTKDYRINDFGYGWPYAKI